MAQRNQRSSQRRSSSDADAKKVGCGFFVILILLFGGCAALTDDSDEGSGTKGASKSSPSPTEDKVKLPNFKGDTLQESEDALRDLSLYRTEHEDLTGEDREPWDPEEWTVCRQRPKPGTKVTSSDIVTFELVRVTEDCSNPIAHEPGLDDGDDGDRDRDSSSGGGGNDSEDDGSLTGGGDGFTSGGGHRGGHLFGGRGIF